MKRMMLLLAAVLMMVGVANAQYQVEITCVNDEVPADGGQVCFDIQVSNFTGVGMSGNIWMVIERGPNCMTPPFRVTCIWVPPAGVLFENVCVNIPGDTQEGEYTAHVYIGAFLQNFVADDDTCMFTKLP